MYENMLVSSWILFMLLISLNANFTKFLLFVYSLDFAVNSVVTSFELWEIWTAFFISVLLSSLPVALSFAYHLFPLGPELRAPSSELSRCWADPPRLSRPICVVKNPSCCFKITCLYLTIALAVPCLTVLNQLLVHRSTT